ncbi:ImmA/IrrE family metallo-endopeptidase [Leisingera caerulea]|uniref:ImmA/IrrE family metallo-endopeptidase n=1 Tax=Leisingera caerulea TaxID=506591 RepID=A0A9Q9HCR1_LEICA|nr:ImmA/IrrE family metallo-endopeptidase [Leisingera caerulea]UWQ52739.1 ImmA/IrrE family metallo-endopeptidase [Leisingera caerulea]
MNAHVIDKPRWKLAEDKANALTRHYSSPPIPVLEIAEQNGVNVVFADFGENSEAVSGFCDFRNARIYVNSADLPERQSFTMAHELGHWLLHRTIYEQSPESYPVLPRFSNPNRHDPLEKEANKFAACLLVPERLLAPVKNAPVSALAGVFGVSRTMMEYRLKNVT